jgi:hypothetical protein
MAGEQRRPDISAAPTTGRPRRVRAERAFLDKIRARGGLRLAAGDGVELTAYALVDELRDEGLRCEHVILALKALVHTAAGQPSALLRELVPLCIVYYYAPANEREA